MMLQGTGVVRIVFACGMKLEDPREGLSTQPGDPTLRQGLSVWAPTRLNPFPGWNWPPTAKAMRVE